MEISQIVNAIFGSLTNIIAAVFITGLTLLALFGTFSKSSSHHKIRHFARQSPAILATVGIFFSFWGISIGLIEFNPKKMEESVPLLLDGLKIKFIASLIGIGASIIVRFALNFAAEEIAETNSEQKIENLLTDIKNVLANGASNSPQALLQELKQAIDELPVEFRKQTALLDIIKSSLAGEGDASVTTQLSKLRSDMRDSFKDMDVSNKQRSDTLNNTLTSNFDNLTQKFEDFARIVAENNSKAFIEALEKAMRDFNNNITEQFGENFKELNRAVGALLTWQDNYKDHVETLTNNFETALNSVSTIQLAFTDIQTRSESFTEVSAELGVILQKLDAQLGDLNFHLKSLSQVADTAKEAFPIIEGNLEKLTSGFKKSTEQSLADISGTVESVGDDLKETVSRLRDTTGKLRESMEGQRETLETTSNEFKSTVDTTLKNLSRETQASIHNYQDSLQEAVTSQLNAIDNNIKQSNTVVSNTIQNASDTFEKSISETGLILKATTNTVGENLVDSMNQHKEILQKTIMDTGTILKNTTVTVANNLTSTTDAMKSTMETQQATLSSTSTEFKNVVNQTMNDLSKETQVSTKNLQQAVTTQLDNIDASIKQNNAQVNQTLQNSGVSFENAIKMQSESMNNVIVSASEAFKKSIQDSAKDFESMAESIAKSVNTQEQTLKIVGQDVKTTIDKTLRDLTDQSKASIKEYEHNLHEIVTTQSTTVGNSIKTASAEFNRLLTENTTKSTNVLKEQTELLDKALQAELIKAMEIMGRNLASLSAKFVQDYAPLTDKLRDVVRLADDLKKGR